ncbi:MAG: hypothetical protein ACSHX4_08370 [Opitutaceae bacterium]
MSRRAASDGFALVIALGLMGFVLVLLLTMSTLVQVEQAGSDTQVQQMEAEQAALLSLNMAIGKLQETAGLDQRVTAPSEAVAGVTNKANHVKQLTGVWRSWEGSDHQSDGLPIPPRYDQKLELGDLDIDPAPAGDGRFLGWLVSSAYASPTTITFDAANPPSLKEVISGPDQTVKLVGSGSVVPDPNDATADSSDVEVHLKPTEIDDGASAIAWWISGENTKALLREKEEPSDEFGWSDLLASNSGPDASEFEITDATDVGKVTSRHGLNLLGNSLAGSDSLSQTYFHDTTGYARGLLTNTANGGWRRDLSLMTEQWINLQNPTTGATGFPFYTLSPGVETEALKNSGAFGGLVYPWAEEGLFYNQNGTQLGGASVGWGALVDFAKQYQQIVSGSSTGNVTFAQKLGANRGRDSLTRLTMLARTHWVFSFSSDGSKAFLNILPVLTYWNPYNVSISGANFFWTRLGNQLPYKMKFSVGSSSQNAFYDLDGLYHRINNLTLNIPTDNEAWQPGESRVYSSASKSANRVNFLRGYDNAVGITVPIMDNGHNGTQLTGAVDAPFQVEIQATGTAFEFSALEWKAGRTQLDHRFQINYNDAELYWPTAEITNTTQTIGTVDTIPSPFMIVMCQLQNITESSVGKRGYSHSKPIQGHLSNRINVGGSNTVIDAPMDAFPYDMVFKYPNGIDGGSSDDGLPVDGITSSDPYGLIGTSYRIDDGLKNLVAAEIPTRPLRSLGELQHFDVAFYNPMFPYIANPIGNSSASHLIEPDMVYIDDGIGESRRASYDHSYVANHLFYDDWFVSSIAPDTNGYSPYPGSETRSIQEVYRDFASGGASLPNEAYVPAKLMTTSAATSEANTVISDSKSWHSVASKIEVNGMFNVNSTSVAAWSALLKHLRNGDMPFVSNNSGSTGWSLNTETGSDDHPVSRTTFSGDPAANAADNPDDPYTEIGTHMRLTDTQIEALATEIVEQVKKRGPFLSLSEFLNRKLTDATSEKNLALAGAVEAALIALSDPTRSADENPYTDLQSTYPDDVIVPASVSQAFPEAALGNLAYGFPGWIRQADILRPLAPILSARDDTFVIRAYGESKNPVTGERSSALCEAVVQRRADYVNFNEDVATVLPSDTTLSSDSNKQFGRRFSIVSFRWLSPDEV